MAKKTKTTHPETLPTDSKPTIQQVEYPSPPSEANQPLTHKTVPPPHQPTSAPKPYAAKPPAAPAQFPPQQPAVITVNTTPPSLTHPFDQFANSNFLNCEEFVPKK
eukprot:3869209-Ditylum_brightwellii.AAC.1